MNNKCGRRLEVFPNRMPMALTAGRFILTNLLLTGILLSPGLSVACVSIGSDAAPVNDAAPPNVVLVLTDDQGWNGTSVRMDPAIAESQSDFYQTPNLEWLAQNGMRFSDAYSAASTCSPTRASILTGRSPARLQMTDLPHFYPPREHDGLPLVPPISFPLTADYTSTSLPTRIKNANPNYETGLIGKWHLDVGGFPLATDMGFDFYASPGGNPTVDPRNIFGWTQVANDFMETNVQAGRPFYLQLAHIAVHTPVQALQTTIDKYNNLPKGIRHKDVPYAAMTEDLDTGLGMLLDKILELGIQDNTYVIFYSDNGSWRTLSPSTPLLRGKADLWEGGIRVPLVIYGPGIKYGTVCRVPVTSMDIYSTILDLVGAGAFADVEGASLVPLLMNKGLLPPGQPTLSRPFAPSGELFFHLPNNYGPSALYRIRPKSAIRDGDFKLVRQYGENGNPDRIFLFDLAANITESESVTSPLNLATVMPAKADELLTKLNNWLEAVDASLAYDVALPVELSWSADSPGSDPKDWRTTNNVDYKARESWTLGTNAQRPWQVKTVRHAPGLPSIAFDFDGNDQLTRKFFHVADWTARKVTPEAGVADTDRSATIETWIRLSAMDAPQLLVESGDEQAGLSLTIGDGDNDGLFNEVRFRAISETGKSIAVTATLDSFADPVHDFVQVVAVFDDDEFDRAAEIYINSALMARTDGQLGPKESIRWDGKAHAGFAAPNQGFGGDGGPGDRPFVGGNFDGQLAYLQFSNYAFSPDDILSAYNSRLYETGFGITQTTCTIPGQRPSDVREGEFEADYVIHVMLERVDRLPAAQLVDIIPAGGEMYGVSGLTKNLHGQLPLGTLYASYLLHFDPNGQPTRSKAGGGVTFDAPIIGILVEQDLLDDTDARLGSLGRYPQGPRACDLLAGNWLSVSEDLRTLRPSLTCDGDRVVQIRVLTAVSDP